MPRKKYPHYPSSSWDYAVRETARLALRKPNKFICLYCHGQGTTEPVPHAPDCPAKDRQPSSRRK